MTLPEASEITSLSVKTLRRAIARGDLPAGRCGHAIRIRVEDLDKVFKPVVGGAR